MKKTITSEASEQNPYHKQTQMDALLALCCPTRQIS